MWLQSPNYAISHSANSFPTTYPGSSFRISLELKPYWLNFGFKMQISSSGIPGSMCAAARQDAIEMDKFGLIYMHDKLPAEATKLNQM